MNKLMTIVILIGLFLLIDLYVYQAVIAVSKNWIDTPRTIFRIAFWTLTAMSIAGLLWFYYSNADMYSSRLRMFVVVGLVMIYFSKVFSVLFLLIDDLQRGVRHIVKFFNKGADEVSSGERITRSQFLTHAAIVAGTVPFTAMAYGILSGAHDYRIRRKTIFLPNLPKSFDGVTIAQLSDIHSGSFFNKTAVRGGIEMTMKEKPDLIFFTGDLVNNKADEVTSYIDVFEKLKAPLGVFSVTGNHDYGDYVNWKTHQDKSANFRKLMDAHEHMGFDLLMNENRFIEINGERIAILGIENWGAGRFAKYGQLDKAHAGTDEANVKLLLSHDPSHWDAQVRTTFPDIDVSFAGHTHGFQFGVEVGEFKWSPSQYVYKQWAGLYKEDHQYLYVNRGFGYIGYPGRIGIPPEITIITLKRGEPV